ncbi:unnamed protein product [Arctia plantaginis]|uniref:Uncharacterized protein n=1 Tax=Arctia plantaginis TaxID=874455 RepID=A0A8S1AQY7_ARCPL|nr:unnamed protein product [Arctia plantaginis]
MSVCNNPVPSAMRHTIISETDDMRTATENFSKESKLIRHPESVAECKPSDKRVEGTRTPVQTTNTVANIQFLTGDNIEGLSNIL